MGLLALKPKPQPKEKNEDQAKTKKWRRGMTAAAATLTAAGLVGLIVFGTLAYVQASSGGWNTITILADGIGILLSGVMMGVGLFAKVK